jgi:hypothetical protein
MVDLETPGGLGNPFGLVMLGDPGTSRGLGTHIETRGTPEIPALGPENLWQPGNFRVPNKPSGPNKPPFFVFSET